MLIRRSTTLLIGLSVAVVLVTVGQEGASSAGGAVPSASASAGFTGHGSINQAYVLGAPPGTRLELIDAAGARVGGGTADRLGSLIVRDVPAGPGYRFRSTTGPHPTATTGFRVLATSDTPPGSFYSGQQMAAGLNYITMRDGVKLAATVRLPPGKTLADGPFPTVIEESGYAIAAPHSLIDAVLHLNGESTSDPLVPDTATAVGSLVAPLLGYATVSLQMRGTGCSGGAFDLFGLPTTYDGYDAVQTVASQPWVAHHKVGMVGISFSGISQMFVAGTRPPGLAAVAPMSLTDDLYSTGFPGGMFNSGFAGGWLAQRIADAEPAPQGGQEYARILIQQGDQQCLADQALHLQVQNLQALLAQASHRLPSLYDQRSPSTWAKRAEVPVFVSGAFQDEQTGGQWPAIIGDLAHDPHVWATVVNGTHVDSLGPGTISRWIEFLDLYVADQVPVTPPILQLLATQLYLQLAGAPSGPVPALSYTGAPSLAAARAAFEQQPRVRVLLDNGGGSAGPGAMQPVWNADFTSWPPPSAKATALRLGPGGALTASSPSESSVSFRPDPSARPATDLPAPGNPWAALPPYDWAPVTGSDGLGFTSPPLAHDVVAIGPASVDLWVKSTAADTDLQATVSEVRPDGKELFVQTGELRASDRALNPEASTATHPVPTYAAATAKPLPSGRFTEVRIPVLPFGYAFRAGSRLRVTITAPGGDRPVWQFDTFPTGGTVTDTVRLGGASPSALVLSVVPAIGPPDPQPACPSLRGQPCRDYVVAGNGG
ncbi:MAG TPA: CocE/NonD family hydrolase [Acidimicrobiales bacterium]|nr:CocE/NonD family hydrolase [Acidimicrobiales bacterium]